MRVAHVGELFESMLPAIVFDRHELVGALEIQAAIGGDHIVKGPQPLGRLPGKSYIGGRGKNHRPPKPPLRFDEFDRFVLQWQERGGRPHALGHGSLERRPALQ